MEFHYKNDVYVSIDMEIGDEVILEGYGKKEDGEYRIEAIRFERGMVSQTNVMVKLKGLSWWLDSGWVKKKHGAAFAYTNEGYEAACRYLQMQGEWGKIQEDPLKGGWDVIDAANDYRRRMRMRIRNAAFDMYEALLNLENDDKSIPAHAWDRVKKALLLAQEGRQK